MPLDKTKDFQIGNKFALSFLENHSPTPFNAQIDNACYNIIWVKKGRANYAIDFKEIAVEDNTILFLTPGQIFVAQSEAVYEGCRMAFTSDFHCVERHSSEISCNGMLFNSHGEIPSIRIDEAQSKRFSKIIRDMIEEFEEGSADLGQQEMILSFFRRYLVEAIRIKLQQDSARDVDVPEEIRLVNQFNALVEKHFRQKHSVSDYADILGISPKTIAKRFNETVNTKPSEVIKNRLLLQAKRELLYTDRSIKEICYEIGFEDPAYFSRYFRKNTGLTPLEFKKQGI